MAQEQTLSGMAGTEAAWIGGTAPDPETEVIEITPEGREALGEEDPEGAEFEEQMKYEYAEIIEFPETFGHLDHKTANRILRRLGDEWRQRALIQEQADDEIKRVQARADELKEAHTKRIEWLTSRYEGMLQEFAAKETEGRRTRTVNLLNGKLFFRRNPSSLSIIDKDAALEWAKTHLPEAVKVAESVGVTPIKSYVEGTGEALPFVEYKPTADRFYMDYHADERD